MVSPITTPSKAQPVPREEGDGDSTHEDMCVKPITESNKTKSSQSPSDSDQDQVQDTTGAFVVNPDVHSDDNKSGSVKENGIPNNDKESSSEEILDSMQVEPGSQGDSHNVTKTFQTATEEETDGALHNSHNWQSRRRCVSVISL